MIKNMEAVAGILDHAEDKTKKFFQIVPQGIFPTIAKLSLTG